MNFTVTETYQYDIGKASRAFHDKCMCCRLPIAYRDIMLSVFMLHVKIENFSMGYLDQKHCKS